MNTEIQIFPLLQGGTQKPAKHLWLIAYFHFADYINIPSNSRIGVHECTRMTSSLLPYFGYMFLMIPLVTRYLSKVVIEADL